jgi:hypothetical protein
MLYFPLGGHPVAFRKPLRSSSTATEGLECQLPPDGAVAAAAGWAASSSSPGLRAPPQRPARARPPQGQALWGSGPRAAAATACSAARTPRRF